MNLVDNNYGLSGQSEQDYDDFVCLGKKCRRRREKRRRIRNERKRLKNEARRADIERSRAETGLIKQTFGTSESVSSNKGQPIATKQNIVGTFQKTGSTPSSANNQIVKGKISPWILFGGLIMIGGFILAGTKKAKKI